jgi:hypothetical protein
VLPDDDLILLRPTSVCEAQYTPLPQKVDVEEQVGVFGFFITLCSKLL